MTLVPAVLAMLGDRAWWLPGWLDRRLPVLDVEGVGLERHLAHDAWTRGHGAAVVRAEGLRVEDTDGSVVLDGVDAVVRPGALVVVHAEDRVARRALLAAVAGRLDVSSGTLVVLDRVLPEEAAAVRRRVPAARALPRLDELEALGGRRRNDDPVLVVVDDADFFASDDELDRRWQALRRLTERGVAVLAGATHLPADGVRGRTPGHPGHPDDLDPYR